jgi:hypothetical protein
MAGIQIDGVNNKIDFDDDADTSISSATDDTLVVEVGGNTLATVTATGVTINDGTTITTADNTDTLTLTSTDTDDNSGPNLRMYRNSASPANQDVIGQIQFEGKNDAGEDVVYNDISMKISDQTDGTEDGIIRFRNMKGGTLTQYISTNHAEICLNEDSADLDFRVESNGDENMFKIDAGNDCALFGVSAQSGGEKVSMRSTSAQKMLVIDNANTSLADQVLQIVCARTGVSNYNFIQCMSDSTSGQDSEFIFAGDGDAFADGTFSNNGADYAEFFETNDGNGIDVGKTVVLDGNKVRASTSSDNASTILGVVRPKVDGINSMIIGNTAWNSWTNKYLHDDYGRFIMEDYSVTEWVVKTYEDGRQQTESYETDKIPEDVTVPDNAVVKTQQRKKFNPAYDKDKEYKPRSERDEWVIIGMLGQIQVEKGQKTGDRWIKMRDISDSVEEWLVR